MLSVLPSLLVLGLVAFAAARLAWSRPSPVASVAERSRAARTLALTLAIQSVHFAEEAATGFHERFPALLGLPGMPFAFFVLFNLAWIGIWLASVRGLRSARPMAYFAAWILAIAGMLNGVAHPLMAIATGGYFPGLVSAPFVGVASIWLCRRLQQATVQGRTSRRDLSRR